MLSMNLSEQIRKLPLNYKHKKGRLNGDALLTIV